MKVIKRQDKREVYTVVERAKNVHALVKVLNLYPTSDDAFNALLDIMQKRTTEEDVLKEYLKNDM